MYPVQLVEIHFVKQLIKLDYLKFLFIIKYFIFLPVASLTTDISVGLPRPDRNKIAETIFLYKLSKSSLVLTLECF